MAWILHLAFLSSSADLYGLGSEVAGDNVVSVPGDTSKPSASRFCYQENLSPIFGGSIDRVKDNFFPAMANCEATIWDTTF